LAFVLFYFIITTVKLKWNKIIRFYVYFILLLNAVLVTSGIGFLLSFHDVFGLDVSEYFMDIKIYSGNIREWLYYDHAVFLTFFGLIGVVLLKGIDNLNRENRGLVMAYHVLLLVTILLVGARISLLIYGVFIINLNLKIKPKLRLASNTIIFLSILLFLFKFIGSVDQNRLGLWSVTWQAIKEKPLLGYGLGSSDQILHQEYFMKKANTVIPEILNHSHNQFLTVLLEIGFIGTSLLVILIVVYLKRTGQYKSMPMVLFIFGLCYVFLTESILQTSKPLFVLCFLFAMITKIPKSVIPNELDSQA
jgi:O-antigen ligase